jgi:hypothetical protein
MLGGQEPDKGRRAAGRPARLPQVPPPERVRPLRAHQAEALPSARRAGGSARSAYHHKYGNLRRYSLLVRFLVYTISYYPICSVLQSYILSAKIIFILWKKANLCVINTSVI